MSSSSCEPEGAAGRLLRRALAVVERESPWHARALADALSGLTVEAEVDGERLTLRVVEGRAVVESGGARGGGSAVSAETGIAAALAMIEGRERVVDALRSRALRVKGSTGDLLRARRCADVLLHGLVRCASSRGLLSELRGQVNREG